jgi:hypothetical protein
MLPTPISFNGPAASRLVNMSSAVIMLTTTALLRWYVLASYYREKIMLPAAAARAARRVHTRQTSFTWSKRSLKEPNGLYFQFVAQGPMPTTPFCASLVLRYEGDVSSTTLVKVQG